MEMLFGSKIKNQSTTIAKMVEMAENNEFVTGVIKGEVYKLDQFNTRTGKLLIKGEIFDGKTEIPFQTFLESKDYPDGIKLKVGAWVALQGELTKNEYTNFEWAMMVQSLAIVESEIHTKVDTAENKRVELSTFTQMSKMRSALPVDKLMEYVKNMGHTHVGVTDTHSVQIYPSAHAAAKKHGVQMIYGTTMSLASETSQVVYGPEVDISLQDATFASFDVETTGFSAVHDEVIEIGAIKTKNGEVISRFQRFIKGEKLIPKHITELTGITQEMIDAQGVSLQNAIEDFLGFIEGTILVAHNATFDRDFIVEACKKVGTEFGERTIVDTLEIARSLEPNASRGNRLNTVAKRYFKTFDDTLKALKKEDKEIKKELKEKEKAKEEIDKATYDFKLNEIKQKIDVLSARQKNLELANHHRADEDAEVAGHILFEMSFDLAKLDITNINQLNSLIGDTAYTRSFPKEITVIAVNEIGKKNLYKLMTKSHIEKIHREPRVTKELINEHREGLLIGSGSHEGPLFELVSNKPIEVAMEEAKFFDFIEIQPSDIAEHLVGETRIENKELIELTWKKIYAIGKKIGKPVVATGHVHYVDEDGELLHNALLYHERAGMNYDARKGNREKYRTGRHLRTTEEMKEAFPWLTDEEKESVVVTNSQAIANQCVQMSPVPDKLYPPKMDGANDELRDLAVRTAQDLYGETLPILVEKRLDKELKSIIGNGFSVIYLISQKLVKNSNDNGYLVGSRGSVGSSFVATMTGITEVNPLQPHYVGKHSKWSVFFNHPEIASGYDLPMSFADLLNEKHYSPECIEHVVGKMAESFNKSHEETIELMKNHVPNTDPLTNSEGLVRDGQDIPFETFLGFEGDKVPDIDLNFSGEYQTKSHKYVEELFGSKYVFRAGTIGTVADKKAYGYVKSYGEENGFTWSKSRVSRLVSLMQGAKSTSGQHPGGILVVPDYMEPEDFTPVQHPAEDPSKGIRTSHFDFHSIHDNILKLDILGHDDPTITRMLQDLTGIEPKTIAPNDPMTLKLFTAPEEALGIDLKDISANTGTLGVPEFGTKFVQQMIEDTKPTKFAELVKISGLSHGTDVWIGNAKNLIDEGTATIANVIDTRDNIMVYLAQMGLEEALAFKIMEDVRKGKGLKPEYVNLMKANNVPDWYIDSCNKIKYMFPKAHAAAYVLSAMRIANFKVYYKKEFYAAILSVRYNEEDIRELNQEPSALRSRLKELESEIRTLNNQGEKNKAGKVEGLRKAVELVLEAKVRGVEFGPVSLEKSHATKYTIHDGVLVPPFISIPGLGKEAAVSVYREFRSEPINSVEELGNRTKLTKTNIDILRDMKCLEKIEDVQHTLF